MANVTMAMVAEAAEVSVATVSRALRNHPRLPLRTRERVKRIAGELGYRPNPLISALVAGRRNPAVAGSATVLAYVSSTSLREEAKWQVNRWKIFEGARARASEQGFRLEEFRFYEPGMDAERMIRILQARGICGAIFGPSPVPTDLGNFRCDSIAMAVTGLGLTNPRLHRSAANYFQSMGLALEVLTGRGYRRLGFAPRKEADDRFHRLWSASFRIFQDELPPDSQIPLLRVAESAAPADFLNWVRTHRPEVVISTDIRELAVLKESGIRVPEEIGYVHLGAEPIYGDVAGIDQNAPLVGAAAVDLVTAQMFRSEFDVPAEAKTVLIEGKWKEGRTIRPLHE